jgi:hypothetical protein
LASENGDEIGLIDIYKKVNALENLLKTSCETQQNHHQTLYGPPESPEFGLTWKLSIAQKDISLIKKVAFALVPGTGIIWAVAQWAMTVVIGA